MKNGSLAVCRNGDAKLNVHGLFCEVVMVSEWRGILAGQAILICMILAYVQVVFGWWVYGVACAVACCNSLAIFGMGRALGKRLSERAIGWSLGFVVRVLWLLRFGSGKLLLGILNGLLPLVWLSVSVC